METDSLFPFMFKNKLSMLNLIYAGNSNCISFCSLERTLKIFVCENLCPEQFSSVDSILYDAFIANNLISSFLKYSQ